MGHTASVLSGLISARCYLRVRVKPSPETNFPLDVGLHCLHTKGNQCSLFIKCQPKAFCYNTRTGLNRQPLRWNFLYIFKNGWYIITQKDNNSLNRLCSTIRFALYFITYSAHQWDCIIHLGSLLYPFLCSLA